ncbi:acyltransferase family protein [Pseudomonas psychrophila]|uniref:Peptidoglycan/LPS O-acetylase OafA/YrhL, contains acyltransferase and SGNH-hydrolase domains n=1 Tax=Pseudomonas psychrophila TaxID=122355 RepID=A0ABY0W1D3_9PSED|nr:acyltransferase [Pseudomonas psychrophila]KAB0491588.1 acyltransferase [Pseudomonas psychrophila]QIE34044.1 acyltransferase [Pseudomonas psychrophila]WVI96139.1 acyltransferase [Pseudomonas psychrophila]SDU68268.1 Peptidoglycan/LPS O-acetylase OafA/YrhL, contains acyltransferase and SGNH-hydrolase domains [Pseudomonas psychrophila]
MLHSIQLLRAVAAWLVVLHHYIQIVHGNQLNGPISKALHMYGAIGVDLFFIISGFVIYLSVVGRNVTPGVFAVHRLARVVPAYWVFTFISAATFIIAPTFLPLTAFEPMFFLQSLLFIPAQNPSGIGPYPLITVGWTLNYEMAFYAVFLLSFYFPKKIQLLMVALGLFLLCKFVSRLGGDWSFYGNKIIYEFLFGIITAIAYKKRWMHKLPTLGAVVMVLVATGMIIYYGQVVHSPIKSGLPCAMIFFAAVSLERFSPKSGLMSRLGDWSYSTYLCHILVMCCMMNVQEQLNLSDAVTFILIIMGIVAVSYSSFRWIEKPISDLVKKNFKTSSVATVAV